MDIKSVSTLLLLAPTLAVASEKGEKGSKPNVIFILADDLGLGDLGCYGQQQIKTPNIDQMSNNGMIFTSHYSGSTVSAPSRCTLMTGKHTGESYIRGNRGTKASDGFKYDEPLASGELTVAEVFKSANYKTACMGKWGLGGPNSEGHPLKQGFDRFYGYLGQANAHRYYPLFIWDDNEKVMLDKKVYTHDLIMDEAISFIKENKDEPFFLYLTPTIPHADVIIPRKYVKEYGYENKFYETPHNKGGYLPCERPNETYAAMVTHLDKGVGDILNLLKELGIDDNTLVVFTSDNGNHTEAGHKPHFFASSGGFRGMKRDMYQGGIRTPFIVQWSGVVKEKSISCHTSAFWDFLPTVCDLVGADKPKDTNGISYLPSLTGKGKQKEHADLYFEFHEQSGKQAVVKSNWKLIRFNALKPNKVYYELYNMTVDPQERHNLYYQEPKRVAELMKIMDERHKPNEIWDFPALNN